MKDKEKQTKMIALSIGIVVAVIITIIGIVVLWNVSAYELKPRKEKIWIPENYEVHQNIYELMKLKSTAIVVSREEFQTKVAKSEKPVVMILSQSTPEKMVGKHYLPVEYLLNTKSGLWIMIHGREIPKDSDLRSELVNWTAKLDEQFNTLVLTPVRNYITLFGGVLITLIGAVFASVLWLFLIRVFKETKSKIDLDHTGTVQVM